ncbi:molecular chaperone DnaJ [Salinibacterium sp. UTAS2018]|uniref:J domain-containing protein n=1 Tax=Salinibacterium sp. UTAS2018 TaxID=2508880 RepID=UPI0010097E2D|nr:DnaJ domain-containing protein [Salinibacterium sp. UTAS2018]QAV69396.1 molecular chaperone DnaJ [Salinibacterium sp. UTAS2018]
MPDSPMSASAYDVLGVQASATEAELKKAFRRALRETHPDTGGDPTRFAAVQDAWDRVGTPEKRRHYDAGARSRTHSSTAASSPFSARPSTAGREDSRPRARTHGHPGGWRRERFLDSMREWVGRGVALDDPYDPALVRSAPREIRRTLADALAEEATARTVSDLGIGYTIWHDVSTGPPERKLDHIVLGPTGLFAMLSEDFGGDVKVRRGELIGPAVAPEKPMHELAARAKSISRQLKVNFTCYVIVVPDDALAQPQISLGTVKGQPAVVVRQSVLAHLLRTGPELGRGRDIGGNELFDVRTRLTSGIRFVE